MRVVAASNDHTLKIMDLHSDLLLNNNFNYNESQKQICVGHIDVVNDIAIFHDGRLISFKTKYAARKS